MDMIVEVTMAIVVMVGVMVGCRDNNGDRVAATTMVTVMVILWWQRWPLCLW